MEEKKHNRILVIAAHPDDEVLGCGGAIARHREEGDAVTVLLLGEGIASRAGVLGEGEAVEIARLKESTRAAHEVLGVSTVRSCAFPDNAFDSVPLLSIVKEIESAIQAVSPTIIYTHHHADVNVDHRLTAEAVEAAIRPMSESSVMRAYAFEIASSSEWNFIRSSAFRPNAFVALTEDQLDKKINAMRAYASEMRPFPHPRSAEYLEALARVRGGQSGYTAAEAFSVIYTRV